MYEIFEQLLQARNVTAYQVAKATGIAQSTLSDWKNGRSIPKMNKMQKIADYFGISVDYLLGNEEKEKPAAQTGGELGFDDFTYALHNETKKLTEENKQKLLEMAKFFQQQQELEAQREKDKNN